MSTPGRHAWIDARSGVAGDMLLGALVDAGAPLDEIQAAVDSVIPATVRLSAHTVRRAGLRATKVDVERQAADLPHRRWNDIQATLDAAALEHGVRSRAVSVFTRLAEAEARAHGVPAADVHFHEVGAWDSIADVVGVAAALEALDVSSLSAGAVALGSGTVRTAHGELPVPVPAVLELAKGWVVIAGGTGELATPTGMAVITALARDCEELPELQVSAIGVGAGTRDSENRPNVVRVVLGQPRVAPAAGENGNARESVVLAANVDDLDPRVWPGVLAELLDAGAADVWLTPILMKKGRPAHTLSVLTVPELLPRLRALVFSLVPTLGVRETTVGKTALARCWRAVEVDGARVEVKLAHSQGVIVTATPEFHDVARAAAAAGRPTREVLDRSIAAAVTAGLTPGRPLPD